MARCTYLHDEWCAGAEPGALALRRDVFVGFVVVHLVPLAHGIHAAGEVVDREGSWITRATPPSDERGVEDQPGVKEQGSGWVGRMSERHRHTSCPFLDRWMRNLFRAA